MGVSLGDTGVGLDEGGAGQEGSAVRGGEALPVAGGGGALTSDRGAALQSCPREWGGGYCEPNCSCPSLSLRAQGSRPVRRMPRPQGGPAAPRGLGRSNFTASEAGAQGAAPRGVGQA